MAMHPSEERHEEYPRNVDRERRHESHGTGRPREDHESAGDGDMVRSEPASSRGGDGLPRHHGSSERARSGNGDRDGHARPDAAGTSGHAGDGERLIRSSESDDLRRRWESIQASFIDSPREAVEEADQLVGELTDRIAERFRSERSGLDTQWEQGDEVSTEELRLTLQRYRGFFDRLLHL